MTSIYFNPNVPSPKDLGRTEDILIAPTRAWINTDKYTIQNIEFPFADVWSIQTKNTEKTLQLCVGNWGDSTTELSKFGYHQNLSCDALIIAGQCSDAALKILEGFEIVLHENVFVAVKFFKNIEPIHLSFGGNVSFDVTTKGVTAYV